MSPETWKSVKRDLGINGGTSTLLKTRKLQITPTTVEIFLQDADYARTMEFAQVNGLRLLTCQEALVFLMENPQKLEKLKGSWFYIQGKGMPKGMSGNKNISKAGEIINCVKSDPEKTIGVAPGPNQLSLCIRSDYNTKMYNRRFSLDAAYEPSYECGAIVCVKDDSK